MDPDRWDEVERIVNKARAQPPSDRLRFVAVACAGDLELRRQIELVLTQGESHERLVGGTPSHNDPEPRALRNIVGRQLGPYEVVSLIGTGGMGEVYRARDTRLARDVVLRKNLCSDRFQLVVMMQAAETRAADEAMRGR
jgi:eukaryotic-like serine/threonine-protein kinase